MDVVHRACDGRRAVTRQWCSTWLEGHTRGMAPVVTLKKLGLATRATSNLAYSNPSPSSHGSAMVRTDRRDLTITKPNQKWGKTDRRLAQASGPISLIYLCRLVGLTCSWRQSRPPSYHVRRSAPNDAMTPNGSRSKLSSSVVCLNSAEEVCSTDYPRSVFITVCRRCLQ